MRLRVTIRTEVTRSVSVDPVERSILALRRTQHERNRRSDRPFAARYAYSPREARVARTGP